MMAAIIKLLILLLLFAITGCANRISNLAPAQLTHAPMVEAFRDPNFKLTTYKTFSVLPYSTITKEQNTNPILEKQMLFALRNMMEGLGYIFVKPENSPDFFVTIDATMHYREIDVPAQQFSVPRWIPDQEIKSTGTSSGYLSGVGAYSGSSTVKTTVPGYFTNETYTVPGYTSGLNIPLIVVVAYDRKTADNIWWGKGIAASNNSDIRIASQWVLKQLVGGNFPSSSYASELTSECTGEEGLGISIFTVDGNNYYPAVLYVAPNSPAEEAGVEVSDFIISINGKSTENKSYGEIRTMQCGKEGERLTLRLFRNRKQLDVSMTRANKEKLMKSLR